MSLESLTEVSFFERARSSLVSKLILPVAAVFTFASCLDENQGSPCDVDTDCGQAENCIDGYCEPECKVDVDCASYENCVNGACTSDQNTQTSARTSAATTDSDGKVYFTETTGERVEVSIKDHDNKAIEDVTVLYVDGDGFEAFLMEHPDYPPLLEIASHNSDHDYILTRNNFNAVTYGGSQKERSGAAADKFTRWNQWDKHGCRKKEEIETYIDGGVLVLKKATGIKGAFSQLVDMVRDYLMRNFPRNHVGDVYGINPSEHGFRGTTSITMVDLRPVSDEVPNNGLDDDCDGEIDETTSSTGAYCETCTIDSCPSGYTCSSWRGEITWCTTSCDSDRDCPTDWSCGDYGNCVPDQHKECNGDDVWWKDACDNFVKRAINCSSVDMTCYNNECVDDNNNDNNSCSQDYYECAVGAGNIVWYDCEGNPGAGYERCCTGCSAGDTECPSPALGGTPGRADGCCPNLGEDCD